MEKENENYAEEMQERSDFAREVMGEEIARNGVLAEVVREDIKRSLEESRAIYFQRITGAMPYLWSATTRCLKCGEWWMWGVRSNLDFTCDKCK